MPRPSKNKAHRPVVTMVRNRDDYLRDVPTLSEATRARLDQPIRWDQTAALDAEIYTVAAAVRNARGPATLLED